MKYGLITFKETENIGDDIQSYSVMRYLPNIDYYIEREKMDLFVPKSNEKVITVMNGWFLHSKINFPPSPYIMPIYISTHLSKYYSGGITTEYLNDYNVQKLKKYEPIGCRDKNTMDLLNNIGVKNYFSGCLTLTIQKDKTIKKQSQICIVDIDEEAEDFIKKQAQDKIKIIKKTHTLDKLKNSKLSWSQRFRNVKKLLDTYQSSKLVITSRLHCALPCLALGTPVVLLYDENKEYTKDRLSDYAKILNSFSTKQFLKLKLEDLLEITNPKEYIKIRNEIERKTHELIKNTKVNSKEKIPNIKLYTEMYVAPKINIDSIYQEAIKILEIKKSDYINLNYEKKYWKKEYNNAIKLKELTEQKEKSLYEQISQEKQNYDKSIRKYEETKEKLKKECLVLTQQNRILKEEIEYLRQPWYKKIMNKCSKETK